MLPFRKRSLTALRVEREFSSMGGKKSPYHLLEKLCLTLFSLKQEPFP